MKTSILYCLGLLSLCSAEISAQRQQVTEFYRPPLDIPMDGQITYSYIVGQDGDNIKDGPLSIKASIKNFERYVQFQKLTINGNYNLTANYKHGSLNGVFSLNSRINYTHGTRAQPEIFTLNGNFRDGIPNGNFTANYVTTENAKMNVNYKNGILIGPYMVDYSNTLVDHTTIKGTLTQNGELTGRWDFNYTSNRITYNFLNGVCLSMSKETNSTPPTLVEKARLLANGKITEEQLRKQNIIVFEDSINLGTHVNQIILRDNVVNFQSLRGYDFSTPNFKKFKYLEKMEYLTDEGFNALLNAVKYSIIHNEYEVNNFRNFAAYKDQFKRVINTDLKGVQYVNMPFGLYHLTTIGEYKGKVYDKIYLTKEQTAALPEKIEEIRRETAGGLTDYLQRTYSYDFNSKFGLIKELDSSHPNIQESIKLYDNLSTIRIDTLQTTPDKEYMIMDAKSGIFYIKKSTIDELDSYKTRLSNLIKDYFTESYQQNITIDYNESIINNINKLDTILQNLSYLINKSALSIVYDSGADRYFCTDGVEDKNYWQLELNKRIKKFTKITHIRLTGIENDTVYCEFTRKGKEVYQTSIKLKDHKILVTSINFAGAKLISSK